VNTNILEKYSASICKVKVMRVRMWPGYIARVAWKEVTQNYGMGRRGRPLPRPRGTMKQNWDKLH
jgi:hypothetical protein